MTTQKIDPFITFGKPDITQAEIDAVSDVLRSGWLSTGSVSMEFAEEFRRFIGCGYAVPVSSCSIGLVLSLMAAGVSADDHVIVPNTTFAATINAVFAVGALPVIVDVDSHGFIDFGLVEKIIDKRVKAIIPVHYTGATANMDYISKIKSVYGISVIEDAAHAFDATYVDSSGHEKRVGADSEFAVFSFYPNKNITCGEGGMVVTKSRIMADRIKVMSLNGLTSEAWKRYGNGAVKNYDVQHIGIKGNLSDINAAVGLVQLKRWDEIKRKRLTVWKMYENEFGKKDIGHSTHLFTIRTDARDELRSFLHSKGIGTGIHFKPLHKEPAYQFLAIHDEHMPNSVDIGQTVLSLPVSPLMVEEDAGRVIQAVREFTKGDISV
jgi:dTDP-4-amino-4,6-dideoxygalactose transaminase